LPDHGGHGTQDGQQGQQHERQYQYTDSRGQQGRQQKEFRHARGAGGDIADLLGEPDDLDGVVAGFDLAADYRIRAFVQGRGNRALCVC
jgi:hypothetical protein